MTRQLHARTNNTVRFILNHGSMGTLISIKWNAARRLAAAWICFAIAVFI
jgi:hypothetical protein